MTRTVNMKPVAILLCLWHKSLTKSNDTSSVFICDFQNGIFGYISMRGLSWIYKISIEDCELFMCSPLSIWKERIRGFQTFSTLLFIVQCKCDVHEMYAASCKHK